MKFELKLHAKPTTYEQEREPWLGDIPRHIGVRNVDAWPSVFPHGLGEACTVSLTRDPLRTDDQLWRAGAN